MDITGIYNRVLWENSTFSKREYICVHIVLGFVLGNNIYVFLPWIVPQEHIDQSLPRAMICILLTSVIGIALTYKKNRGMGGLFFNILSGMGLYTILTVGMYLPVFTKIMMISTSVITLVGFVLIICRAVKQKSSGKQIIIKKLLRCARLIRRNVGAAAILALLVLPFSLHSMADAEEVDALAVVQAYGDEYRLADNLDTIKLIRDNETFQSLDYERKCEVLEALIRCEGRYLGLCEFDIVFDEQLPDTTMGHYNHAKRTITINANVVRDGTMDGGTAEDLIRTCLEECRHCYQHLMVELYVNATPEQRNLYAFAGLGVEKWLENLGDYQSAFDDDEESYLNYLYQPVEIDAKSYADVHAQNYYSLIDELLEEQ